MLVQSSEKLKNFECDMRRGLEVTRDHGFSYELHSNSKIPQVVKNFLNSLGIKFTEWL